MSRAASRHNKLVSAVEFIMDFAAQRFYPCGNRFCRNHFIDDIRTLHYGTLLISPLNNTYSGASVTRKKKLNAKTF